MGVITNTHVICFFSMAGCSKPHPLRILLRHVGTYTACTITYYHIPLHPRLQSVGHNSLQPRNMFLPVGNLNQLAPFAIVGHKQTKCPVISIIIVALVFSTSTVRDFVIISKFCALTALTLCDNWNRVSGGTLNDLDRIMELKSSRCWRIWGSSPCQFCLDLRLNCAEVLPRLTVLPMDPVFFMEKTNALCVACIVSSVLFD